jgi:hypothetical protein
MAYINQEEKKVIAEKLKTIIPKTWKYSLSIHHRNTIVCVIKSADIDIMRMIKDSDHYIQNKKSHEFHYGVEFIEKSYQEFNIKIPTLENAPKLQETLEKILLALNTNNYDHSDAQTDYFDVGHYVDFSIGSYKAPLIVTGE